MELGKNGGIQNIIPGHPGSFLQPVTLPVNKIFQAAGPSMGVQDALYPVDGGFCLDLILDIITVSRSSSDPELSSLLPRPRQMQHNSASSNKI